MVQYSELEHPNIIEFKGLCEKPLRVVMEFAPCGDLHQLIREQDENGQFIPKAKNLSWEFRYQIALNIAHGLQYLAEKGIIHRDVRSPNIFMVNITPKNLHDRVAVVADFGLSVYALPKVSGTLRTWRWLAPEVFHFSSSGYDTTSDIYSFGVVLWELIEGTYPFGEFPEDEWEVQESIVKDHLRPTIPEDETICNPLYAHLIRRCWSTLPLDRPTWKEIITTLLHLLNQPTDILIPTTTSTVPKYNLMKTLIQNRDRRFSSFSEATKPTKVRAQFELPEKIQTMVVVNATLWMGTRDGEILIYSAQLAKGTLKNPAVVKSWNISVSIIALHSIVSSVDNHRYIWAVSQDGSIYVYNCDHSSYSCYDLVWNYNPPKKEAITSVSISTNSNGETLLWTAILVSGSDSYVIQVWDTNSKTPTSISLSEPPSDDDGSIRLSCIVDMCQFGNIMLVGSYQYIFIVNIEKLVLIGYWQAYTSLRLVQLLSIPSLQQVWTFTGNSISVWKITSDLNVSLIKELDGHTSKITSACLSVRGRKFKKNSSSVKISTDSTSSLLPLMVWTCSFDGQILVWDPVRLIGVHEAFLIKDDVPWEIMPINSRYIVINTHCATSVKKTNDMVSRLVFYRSTSVQLERGDSMDSIK